MQIEVDQREIDAILAALRNWQEAMLAQEFIPTRLREIAENGRKGDDAALRPDEIDDLCERLNCG